MQIDIVNIEGKKVGELDLADAVFAAKVKDYLLWEVVKAQRAASARRHAHDQDARRGARRRQEAVQAEGDRQRPPGLDPAPQFVGGGKVSGPQPRDYSYTVPKKVKRAALASALSLRAQEKKLVIVDELRVRRAQDQARWPASSRRWAPRRRSSSTAKGNINLSKSARNLARSQGPRRPRGSTSTTSSTTRAS